MTISDFMAHEMVSLERSTFSTGTCVLSDSLLAAFVFIGPASHSLLYLSGSVILCMPYSVAFLAYSSKKSTNSGKNDSNVGYLSRLLSYFLRKSPASLIQTNPCLASRFR